MINFENSDISNIVIHHVGNKFEGGGLTLSDGLFPTRRSRCGKFIEKLFLVPPSRRMLITTFCPMKKS